MQREADRQAQLLQTHITSQQKYDEARHNLDAARQQLSSAQQQLANVLASLGGNPDIPTDQHPLVLQAKAQVDQAALDLSDTVIRAPADGYVALVNKLPVGQYLTAATPAFNLVTTDRAWIEANFKETDLTRMRPGQNATCDIDTYPDREFRAHVDSISAGTGSEFSVLPAQNSTGNWVKIVQRIPVRLAIDNPDPNYPLRAGMSATCTVDTRTLTPWNSEQTASAAH
jgi:membrane fusion protein (multidrug efflux system)